MTSSRSGHKLERLELVLCSGQHVLMPGFDRQELAEAKAQISHEYSLCPGVEKLSSRSGQDTLCSPPTSPLLFWYGPASARASPFLQRGPFRSPVS